MRAAQMQFEHLAMMSASTYECNTLETLAVGLQGRQHLGPGLGGKGWGGLSSSRQVNLTDDTCD
jgi:hypothetical protein